MMCSIMRIRILACTLNAALCEHISAAIYSAIESSANPTASQPYLPILTASE